MHICDTAERSSAPNSCFGNNKTRAALPESYAWWRSRHSREIQTFLGSREAHHRPHRSFNCQQKPRSTRQRNQKNEVIGTVRGIGGTQADRDVLRLERLAHRRLLSQLNIELRLRLSVFHLLGIDTAFFFRIEIRRYTILRAFSERCVRRALFVLGGSRVAGKSVELSGSRFALEVGQKRHLRLDPGRSRDLPVSQALPVVSLRLPTVLRRRDHFSHDGHDLRQGRSRRESASLLLSNFILFFMLKLCNELLEGNLFVCFLFMNIEICIFYSNSRFVAPWRIVLPALVCSLIMIIVTTTASHEFTYGCIHFSNNLYELAKRVMNTTNNLYRFEQLVLHYIIQIL